MTTARKRPGRPRETPRPHRIGPIKITPALGERLDKQLAREATTTQRAFIERAIGRELDDPRPPEENDEHHDGSTTRGAGTGA